MRGRCGCDAEFFFSCFMGCKCTSESANKQRKPLYLCKRNRMAEKNDTGREGEAEAKAYLVRRGYTVLHTNWRWHHYELDIVATDTEMLVVVEVKTRSADFLTAPEEAVDMKKIRRTVSAADAYVRHFQLDFPVRFDIITVIKSPEGFQIDHIDDAFFAPCR